MSIAFERLCLTVLFAMPQAVLLSVHMDVACCECPSSSRVVRMGRSYFAFIKSPATSVSAAELMTFLMSLARA
jgi:hypothetical protein